jgi:formamidopyrimidine-DNA glycosylase
MHLGMSGSFRIEPSRRRRPDRETALERRHDHVVFEMSSRQTVTFNDPRRFGMMQLLAGTESDASGGFASLGPEPLAAGFTPAALAAACAGRRVTLKAALLEQAVVAGLGNIYASEALHLAHLSPLRLAKTIATSTGAPRPAAVALTTAIRRVLRRAIARRGGIYGAARFRVYDREGQTCPTPGCRGTITRIVQSGRSTFYCPVCQR